MTHKSDSLDGSIVMHITDNTVISAALHYYAVRVMCLVLHKGKQLLLLLLHPFNGLFSRTTWVSQHQKGKPFWILLQQETTGWQWHQLDHMQIICTSLQTDNLTTQVFTGRMPFLLPNQQRQSTEGTKRGKLNKN